MEKSSSRGSALRVRLSPQAAPRREPESPNALQALTAHREPLSEGQTSGLLCAASTAADAFDGPAQSCVVCRAILVPCHAAQTAQQAMLSRANVHPLVPPLAGRPCPRHSPQPPRTLLDDPAQSLLSFTLALTRTNSPPASSARRPTLSSPTHPPVNLSAVARHCGSVPSPYPSPSRPTTTSDRPQPPVSPGESRVHAPALRPRGSGNESS